jgi:hypothetical protein
MPYLPVDHLLTPTASRCCDRTWKKLSPHGKAAAGTIPLEEGLKKMVGEAVGEIDKQTASQGGAAKE